MPNPGDREILRKLFPGYDEPGDSVVVSIMASDLTEDRRYSLVATYKRLVREQQEADARSDA